MGINPNQAFEDAIRFTGRGIKKISRPQMVIIEHGLKQHKITWYKLCSYTLNANRPLTDISFEDAARCILKLNVWDNLKKAGDV